MYNNIKNEPDYFRAKTINILNHQTYTSLSQMEGTMDKSQ